MKTIPFGKVITVGKIRDYFAKQNHADFTDPITAGIFVSIAAWASEQRTDDETPYWRTLKANGELNPKYPGGTKAQKLKLEAEGHTVIQKGRKNLKYYGRIMKMRSLTLYNRVNNFRKHVFAEKGSVKQITPLLIPLARLSSIY